jgi:hypothetical protein
MATKAELQNKRVIIPDGYKIKWSGVFDLEELYMEMYRWFQHYGYSWKELKYRVVDLPGGGQQIEIKWQMELAPDDYSTYVFNLHVQIFGSEVEVNVDNIKKKMHKGSLEYRFEAYIAKNIDLWKGKFLGSAMGLLYEKAIIKSRLEAQEEEFFGHCQKFFSELKAFLSLY